MPGPSRRLPALPGRRRRGIDDGIGTEGDRQLATARREVGGDDRANVAQAECRDHREADRPAADDERRVLLRDAGLADGVQADGHRLRERGVIGRQVARHRKQHRFCQAHVLAVAARVVVRVADRLRSRVTHQDRPRADARADGQRTGRARPVIDDLGAELVAHHDVAREVHDARIAGAAGRRHEHVGVLERVQVGSTDPARERPHEHLARPRLGHRHVSNEELPITHHGGTHGVSFPARRRQGSIRDIDLETNIVCFAVFAGAG
jgi:hypothetical protein